MKANLDLFNKLCNEYSIDVNMFYCINIRKSDISIQGKYDIELVKHFKMLGFQCDITHAGFTEFKMNNFTIVLG